MRSAIVFAAASLMFSGQSLAANVPACQQFSPYLVQPLQVEIWPDELPADDYLDVIEDCAAKLYQMNFDTPESLWLERQRAAYSTALKEEAVDVLVVPFQVQGYAVDRIERALMSADLAYALGGVRVADPFHVARALGEGQRRYDRNEIVKLAHELGAKIAVAGYVGHDRDHQLTVTIQVIELDSTKSYPAVGAVSQKDWRSLPFTDVDPPFAVFHRLLPSAIAELSLTWAASGFEVRPPRLPTQLAFSLVDLASERPEIGTSAALSLLGAFSASGDERSRERLFERAFVTSLHFDEPGVDTTFIRAYALLGLERRPAALALINNASTPEAVALRALLNGDLPGATAAVEAIGNPFRRLLLSVYVDDMRAVYENDDAPRVTDAAIVLGSPSPDWQILIEGRLADKHRGQVEDPSGIKYLLDETYPVAGLGLRDLLEGSLVLGSQPDEIDLDLANLRHITRFVATAPALNCCMAENVSASVWDLVSLLEGRAEARIVKHFDLEVTARTPYDAAGAEFQRYDDAMSGHPMLADARINYARRILGRVAQDAAQRWTRQAMDDALLLAHWLPGQHPATANAVQMLQWSSPPGALFVDAYGFDYPRRIFWPEWMYGTNDERLAVLASLAPEIDAYSRTDARTIGGVARGASDSERARLRQQLESRFVGHPMRFGALASVEPPPPRDADPMIQIRAALEADPSYWPARLAIGKAMIERDGTFDEAAKFLLEHPPFAEEAPSGRVDLSNDAFEAGQLFYWFGREDLAVPFYEISAGLQTGSFMSVTSESRLHILAGRYFEAADVLLARLQRYSHAYSYRDFLSFVHAFGYGEQAWSAFSQIASAFDNPQAWVSALVGHRRDGRTEAEIREWLKSPGIRDAKFRSRRPALSYAILVNATDHAPPRDLGDLVAEIEGEPEAWVDDYGYTNRPHRIDPTGLEIIHPSTFATGADKAPENTPVKSEFAYFGAGYAALWHGNYGAAVVAFTELASHYPIEKTEYSYVLPYFAWAAANAGAGDSLEHYLGEQRDADTTFDYLLARAFFAGARKEAESARTLLERAFRVHPYTDFRPVLVEYQYAQACEWLYKATGDTTFVDLLLDWVTSHQAIQPTHAWAYAMEYVYARSGEQRVRALAMTRYLDPTSERIRSSTPEEVAQADAWIRDNNPFLPPTEANSDPLAAGNNYAADQAERG